MRTGIDFTNEEIGTIIPYVDTDLQISLCPFCGRNGLDLRTEIGIITHVLNFVCDDLPENSRWHAPFWSSDVCREGNGRWSISYPAIALPNRIKHPKEPTWTDKQIIALKEAMDSGFKFGPTAYGLDDVTTTPTS